MSPTSEGRTDPRFVRHLLEMDGPFARNDEGDDSLFYSSPRLTSHLDAHAMRTVETLVRSLVPEERPVILDLMASVDSHLPADMKPERVVGLGMNEEEMRANPDLDGLEIQDLNADPRLPYGDGTFDVVLNIVSVEYLTHPVAVFREVNRVLKPGGLFLVVFSTRWFPEKVVRVWEEAKEEERIGIVEEFFRRAGGYEDTDFFISMGLPRPEEDRFFPLGVPSDPIFAVFAEKEGKDAGMVSRTSPPDPAAMEVDTAAVQARKRVVGETLTCPYCGGSLNRWEVPDDPCIDWPNEYLYLCFNDYCPFVVRGWRHMWNQGILGVSYRYLFNPLTGGSTTVPIRSLADLRPGIVEKEEAERYPRSGMALPGSGSLSNVPDYGPDLGGPRG